MRISSSGFLSVAAVAVASFCAACSNGNASAPDETQVSGAGNAGAPVGDVGGAGGAPAGGAPEVAGVGNGAPTSGGTSAGGAAGSQTAGAPDVMNTAGANRASGGGAGAAPVTTPKQRIVGYLPGRRGPLEDWATKLDFTLLSYVDVCFAGIDDNGNVSYSDSYLPQFATAAHAKGGKVCLSLGGGGTGGGLGGLASLIAPAKRADFVSKLAAYATSSGIDCIDVDFEGTGVNQDYEGFVTALGTSLHAEHKEMSAAVASWFGKQVTGNALQAFDFVNVMAYDLHNPAGTSVPVQGSSVPDSKAEIDYWVGRGLSKDKAVLGIPFYGYQWAPGAKNGVAVTYSEILSGYGAGAAQVDEMQKNGTTVYYSGKPSTQAKAALAQQYGGIMIWELGQDANGADSLLRALGNAP